MTDFDEFMALPDREKEEIAECVDQWRNREPAFEDLHIKALKGLSSEDLLAVYRKDPGLIKRVQDAIEQAKTNKMLETHITYEIVPYTVADTSIAEIIRRGPDALYPAWEEAMLERASMRGADAFVERVQDWRKTLKKESESLSQPTSDRSSTKRSMIPV